MLEGTPGAAKKVTPTLEDSLGTASIAVTSNILLIPALKPVSYTHLTLPTNREV